MLCVRWEWERKQCHVTDLIAIKSTLVDAVWGDLKKSKKKKWYFWLKSKGWNNF